MTLEQSVRFLIDQKAPPPKEMPPFEKIEAALRVFLASEPTREEFNAILARLPLSPGMLWDIVQHITGRYAPGEPE